MGLLVLTGPERSAVKRPELTPFGRVVLLEDPYLKLPQTQWLAHFNLCSPLTGADAWYHTFLLGADALGGSFDRAQIERHLSLVYGVEQAGLIGPMIGTYEDEAAFRTCGALSESSGTIRRKTAPVSEDMARSYGTWILGLVAAHFPKARQVAVTELDRAGGWHRIPGWDLASRQRVLELVVRKGLVDVDRHMEPWLITPAADLDQAWKRIFEDIL
jgi:hypothetical protein